MASPGGAEPSTANRDSENPAVYDKLMQEICERRDLEEALNRVLRIARYADNCNIYVSRRLAGNRVMAGVPHFRTTRLKLKFPAYISPSRPNTSSRQEFLSYIPGPPKQSNRRVRTRMYCGEGGDPREADPQSRIN